ncbi:MAG: tetratricopeptide repeat protein [Halioglobus sp.]|nr:tetratricopeptide repeat protein [Halioglobus sp.]
MESYTTEEEQLEALRRWWNENGRYLLVAVVVALAGVFGWQAWQSSKTEQLQHASDVYQAMMRELTEQKAPSTDMAAVELADQLKKDYGGTTYAQFAALHLAAIAVNRGDLENAEQELRWVLGKAAKGSDIAEIAQLRLARVLAAEGATEQALAVLADTGRGAYAATYAVAEGDILMAAGRPEEARRAYTEALAQSGGGSAVNLPVLQQKIQSLTPVAPRPLEASVATPGGADAAQEE